MLQLDKASTGKQELLKQRRKGAMVTVIIAANASDPAPMQVVCPLQVLLLGIF
jgi:hypothetical protein